MTHGFKISDKKNDRLKQAELFKYLSSIIGEKGGLEEEDRHCVGPEMIGIVFDKNTRCRSV